MGHRAWLLAWLVCTYGVFVPRSVLGHSAQMADSVWACTSKSRNTEDQRRVLKEKTSSRLIAPSNFKGRIPLAKDRGRHYCIGMHLSTKMADSVESRVEPAAGKI